MYPEVFWEVRIFTWSSSLNSFNLAVQRILSKMFSIWRTCCITLLQPLLVARGRESQCGVVDTVVDQNPCRSGFEFPLEPWMFTLWTFSLVYLTRLLWEKCRRGWWHLNSLEEKQDINKCKCWESASGWSSDKICCQCHWTEWRLALVPVNWMETP